MNLEPQQFMLDSLRELQTSLLLLMERAGRLHVSEADELGWTLTNVITAYRDFQAGRIDWGEALGVYQVASNVQLACDAACVDVEMQGSFDWQMARRAAQKSR